VDLQPYRAAVRRACDELSLGVVDMKDFEAADLDAVRASLGKLDQAGVYVGVFALRYGFVPSGLDRSVTEIEFDQATALKLERLCFLLDDSMLPTWPDDAVWRDQPDQVAAFKRKVQGSGLVTAPFTTPHDLQHRVFVALLRWMGRQGMLGPRQIPPPTPDFVGRAEALAALAAGFEQGACIRGVRGQGGVGKTQLALKLAELVGDRFRDGNVFVDLHGFDPGQRPLSRREVMAHVIHAFRPEERLPESDEALEGLYHSVLAGKRVLLLFDNARGEEQLHRLLPHAGCAVLVTSRRRFALPNVKTQDLDVLPATEAEKLLRSVAPRLQAEEAAEVARLCGWLPLALRLAGAELAKRDDLSVKRYVERLRAGRLSERSGLAGVATTIRLSEETLPETLRTRWRELSVFAGGFETAWAAAVWHVDEVTSDDWLGLLRGSSLIEWGAKEELYRLHDLVREHALERLGGEAREAAARRHAVYFCKEVQAADDAYERGDIGGLRRFDRVWLEAQRGFAWARERRQGDAELSGLCVGYVIGCPYACSLRQHPTEQITWLEVGLAAARDLGDRAGEGRALRNLGNAYAALGQPQRAIELHQQDLAIACDLGDRAGEGTALGNLGVAHRDLGQPQRAIELYEQHLAIARDLGDRAGEGRALGNLGNAYADLGQPQRAIELYEQRLAVARDLGDRRGEAFACWNMANALVELHRTAEAIPLMELGVAYQREVCHPDAEKYAARVEELRRRLESHSSQDGVVGPNQADDEQ
jgi:tetratricopeptide (TPR) repeat protein